MICVGQVFIAKKCEESVIVSKEKLILLKDPFWLPQKFDKQSLENFKISLPFEYLSR